jgi:ABC-type polysaccharide/polyol phosphate export permease
MAKARRTELTPMEHSLQDHTTAYAKGEGSEALRERIWIRSPRGRSPSEQLVELWHRRKLFGFVISYGLDRLYSKAHLGIAWLFIRPAIMVGGAVLVVGHVLGVQTAPVPLLLFMLASFAPWLLFQRGILMGTRSFSTYKMLLERFLFPRLMVQIASIASSFLIFILVFAVFLIAAAYFFVAGIYAMDIGWHSVWVPISVIMMMLLVWGIGFVTAPLNAFAGDTRLTLRYVSTLAMIVSPVFYPVAQLDEKLRSLMWYNPLACIMELYRWGLFHQTEPSWWHIGLSAGIILVIFVSGWWFFSWCEQRALEEI